MKYDANSFEGKVKEEKTNPFKNHFESVAAFIFQVSQDVTSQWSKLNFCIEIFLYTGCATMSGQVISQLW